MKILSIVIMSIWIVQILIYAILHSREKVTLTKGEQKDAFTHGMLLFIIIVFSVYNNSVTVSLANTLLVLWCSGTFLLFGVLTLSKNIPLILKALHFNSYENTKKERKRLLLRLILLGIILILYNV